MQKPTTPTDGEPVRRTSEARRRVAHLQRHHVLGGLVGLGQRHLGPRVEIRGEGREPGLREPVGRARDLVDEAPPFLDHEDTDGPFGATGREGQVPVRMAAVARKFDRFTHVADPTRTGPVFMVGSSGPDGPRFTDR